MLIKQSYFAPIFSSKKLLIVDSEAYQFKTCFLLEYCPTIFSIIVV
uniref:Uncharacterized protein n=1 Tax=Rhizophora mucronata TaxID=61149 RepID=A0A2P2N4X5_RHIMU